MIGHGGVAVEAREPQARAAGVGRGELKARAGADGDPLAGAQVLRVAQLHDPPAVPGHVRRLRRDMEHRLRAVLARGRQRRGQGGRRVDDEQVAGRQEPRQVAELRVLDPAAGAIGDHQPDLVALQAAGLGGRRGLEGLRELEGERGHALTGERSWAR